MSAFACSVIVPSCNRAAKLDLLLAALAAQDTTVQFEVIVVLDGSTDSSRDVLATWDQVGVFDSLRWHEQERKGQAVARNTGSFLARAPVLLFLDDDVVPDPNLISVHMRHHAAGERIVVLGDSEIVRSPSPSLSELTAWMWWEDTNARRAAVAQPPSYRDFCTGNVSLRREDFAREGGFDPDFTGYGGEDYELGYRLLVSGVRFVADRDAHARHFATTTVRGRCAGARQEARGDVLIARKHPELIPGLRLASAGSRRSKVAAGLAMYAPWLGAALCYVLRGLLKVEERMRLRRRWSHGVSFLLKYAYWRGLHDAVGSMRDLRKLRATAILPAAQQIDVSLPLLPQVARLNIDVPSRLFVLFDGRPVGRIDLQPNLDEPFLPWLSHEICARLSREILAESARAALAGTPVDVTSPAFLDPH